MLPIPGYEGLYSATADGQIFSHRGQRLLRQWKTTNGYLSTCLCGQDGKGRKHRVHRLIALAFIGPCPEGWQINHKDGNRTNNVLLNLEYCTRVENMRHAREILGRKMHDREFLRQISLKGGAAYKAKRERERMGG